MQITLFMKILPGFYLGGLEDHKSLNVFAKLRVYSKLHAYKFFLLKFKVGLYWVCLMSSILISYLYFLSLKLIYKYVVFSG